MNWSVAINAAKDRLDTKIRALDLDTLPISGYNKRYLTNKRRHLSASLNLYGSLLGMALEQVQPQSMEEMVIVDYGGGSGLMSLLAAEAGIGTVIYNDIFDVSGEDVRLLSGSFSLPISHIVCGDVGDLVSYVRNNHLKVDAVVSYDCLEHIYDVEDHFNTLAKLSDTPFRVIYGSGANIANPRYVRAVKPKQIKAEFQDSEAKWGHKERDALGAFYDIRAQMIAEYAPDLDKTTVAELAASTRGLMKPEIHTAVKGYQTTGKVTHQLSHPTNTCDPHNGNWCEHLMEFDWLNGVVRNAGFENRILPGTYQNFGGSFTRRVLTRAANTVIRVFGSNALFIAPYYMISGERVHSS